MGFEMGLLVRYVIFTVAPFLIGGVMVCFLMRRNKRLRNGILLYLYSNERNFGIFLMKSCVHTLIMNILVLYGKKCCFMIPFYRNLKIDFKEVHNEKN